MYIVSIKVMERANEATNLQTILTKYGNNIETRIGINTLDEHGLIIIVYNNENIEEFITEINKLDNVKTNYMKA